MKNIGEVFNEGVAAFKRGKFNQAHQLFTSILQVDKNHAASYHMIGYLFFHNKRIDESIDYFKAAVNLQPNNEEFINSLGKAYLLQENFASAFECFSKALAINPKYFKAHINLGRYYKKQNAIDKAIDHYVKALEIEPGSVPANNNLGNLLQAIGKNHDAINCYHNILRVNPNKAEVHLNLGNIYKHLKDYEKASFEYRTALKLNPALIGAEYELILIRIENCDWSQREYDIKRFIELVEIQKQNKITTAAMPLLVLGYTSTSPEIQAQAAALNASILKSKIESLKKELNFTFTKDKKKKLRIGYVSPDFREHAVGILIHDMFRHHNKEEFEIFAYSTDKYEMSDGYSENIRSGCDHFKEIGKTPYVESAKLIHDDKIDILIDLAGYTTNALGEIFALQPAPIQALYLGYPNTTGAEYIQYTISDPLIITDELVKVYSEKIVFLPQTFISSPLKISEKPITRKDYGTAEDEFVFCNFNNTSKLEPDSFKSWMNILHRTSNSILWLSDSGNAAKENLLNEAEKEGIDKSRIKFLPKIPLTEFLARNKLADLFLDNFYFNAGTTAVCSLISGLPVLTLPGKTFSSRMGASILTSAGVTETICRSIDEYEELAVNLAANKNKLDEIKTKVTANHNSAPLYDTKKMVGYLEKAYKVMWNNFINDIYEDITINN